MGDIARGHGKGILQVGAKQMAVVGGRGRGGVADSQVFHIASCVFELCAVEITKTQGLLWCGFWIVCGEGSGSMVWV